MAWLKIDDNAPHHRKQLAAGPIACWLWVCGLAYCCKHATDGRIPGEAVPFLGVAQWAKAVPFLLRSGLWIADEPHGYIVHDFLTWNDSAATRKEKAAESAGRVARFRESRKRLVKQESNSVTPLQFGNGGNGTPIPTPLPLPKPQPKPQGEERAAAIVSPADYDKLLRHNAYVGARLRVPLKLHADFVAALGGSEPDTRLRAWYALVDAEIERTGEAIVPTVWKWLEARYRAWLPVVAVPVARDADLDAAAARKAEAARQNALNEQREREWLARGGGR